ncbi:hypothetical protein GJ496_005700 [Pomphorhynchus laevis]|nr:hypothetical protein GJ496_005700 [Pomphorhynchus laevis]
MSIKEVTCTKGYLDYLKMDLHSKCLCNRDLKGTITIITGANSGIGYETARVLCDKGSKVILACRSEERAKEAMDKILIENPKADVVIEIIDMGDMSSVRSFADRVSQKYDRIDLLINNAGVCINPCLSKDGYEIHFAVNHLGHFLLTNLLLENLKKSSEARVINVSSDAHYAGRYNFSKLQEPCSSKFLGYASSKLYNILFTKELNKRLKGTNVTTFSLHPGAIDTNFGRNFNKSFVEKHIFPKIYYVLQMVVLKTPIQGAQSTLHAALSTDILKHSGCHIKECSISTPSSKARDGEKAAELWDISKTYCGLTS